jgi:hypothetical protein
MIGHGAKFDIFKFNLFSAFREKATLQLSCSVSNMVILVLKLFSDIFLLNRRSDPNSFGTTESAFCKYRIWALYSFGKSFFGKKKLPTGLKYSRVEKLNFCISF